MVRHTPENSNFGIPLLLGGRMTVTEDVVSYLSKMRGVVCVREMDDKISNAIKDIESKVKTRIDDDYVNVGYEIAMKKAHRVFVIFGEEFQYVKYSVVKLMSSDGTILGTTLSREEIPEYKKRDDVIWISEDFVVFPYVKGQGEEAFVLYPFEIKELDENIPGCKGAIGTSPTTSSDIYLKKIAGVGLTEKVYTIVVAFDEA